MYQKLFNYLSANFDILPLENNLQEIIRIVNEVSDANRDDAEVWLGEQKDIWHHPLLGDRKNRNSYEVADLMAEFANWYFIKNKRVS